MEPRVLDLFAGAGLFSWAFKETGFKVVGAVELDPVAAKTYAQNIGGHVKCADVKSLLPWTEYDVLVAGPPCQGFSTLGKRNPNDPRNALSLELLKWVRQGTPLVIVIENVAAFIGSPVWSTLRHGLERMGYDVEAHVLNANHYGVPQVRYRSFTIASRIGLPIISPPRRKAVRTVREAWAGLPPVPDGKNHHYSPMPSELALARMRVIPAGGDKRDIMRHAPQLAPPSWWNVGSAVTDVWGRMEWDKPSNTLRTALQNASKGRYIHPEQNRVISLREAARLQTIPDSWTFAGPPTHVARQIGNSVPPSMGMAIAKGIYKRLCSA